MLLNKQNKKSLTCLFFGLAFLVLLVPAFSLAAEPAGGSGSDVFNIENPIKATSLQQLLYDVLNIIVQIAIPVLVVATIYVGFLFVSAGGDTGKVGNARKAATNLLIGALIVLGAFAISEGIKNTVEQIGPVQVSGMGE